MSEDKDPGKPFDKFEFQDEEVVSSNMEHTEQDHEESEPDVEITTEDNKSLVEQIARAQGWNPEDGPLSAEEYIRRGPLLKEISARGKEVKNLSKDRDELREQNEKLQSEMSTIKTLLTEMQQEKIMLSLQNLQTERRNAIQNGDVERVDAIEEELRKLSEKSQQYTDLKPKSDLPEQLQGFASRSQEHTEWTKQNLDWLQRTDIVARRMRAEAEIIGQELSLKPEYQANTPAVRQKLFKAVQEHLYQEFPDQFGRSMRGNAVTEDREPLANKGGKKKIRYQDLPERLKQSYDVNVTKLKAFTPEEFFTAIKGEI
jgi:hypothetical protein